MEAIKLHNDKNPLQKEINGFSQKFFTKIKSENLIGGLVFWITIYFFGAIICGARIAAWY